MGRQASLFAARNDMDQSQETRERQRRHLRPSMLPSSRSGRRTSTSSAPTTSISATTPPTGPDHRLGELEGRSTTSCWRWATRSARIPIPIPRTPTSSPAQIQFEFEQSKLLLEQKLGITIEGAAVPGAPENLATSQLIGQYFSYMTGGYTGVGAGYPGAFGYITPGLRQGLSRAQHEVRLLPGRGLPEYGGGMTADAGEAGMGQGVQRTLPEVRHAGLRLAVARLRTDSMGDQRRAAVSATRRRCTPSSCATPMSTAPSSSRWRISRSASRRSRRPGFNYSFDSASNTITPHDGSPRTRSAPSRSTWRRAEDRERVRLVRL